MDESDLFLSRDSVCFDCSLASSLFSASSSSPAALEATLEALEAADCCACAAWIFQASR